MLGSGGGWTKVSMEASAKSGLLPVRRLRSSFGSIWMTSSVVTLYLIWVTWRNRSSRFSLPPARIHVRTFQ